MDFFHQLSSGLRRGVSVRAGCAVLGWLFCSLSLLVSAQVGSTHPPQAGSAGAATPASGTATVPGGTNAPPSPSGTNAPATGAVPDAEAAAGTNDFRSFQVVVDRNIFNASRTRRSRGGSGEGEKPKPPKIDVIALSGTMISPRKQVAFFDSSDSEFRKAVPLGDPIAGYRIREIQQNQVALERNQETLRLKVGEQLRREDEGEWKVTRGESFTSNAGSSSTTGSDDAPSGSGTTESASSSSSGEAGPGASDALKRLLEKRKKEQAQ